MQLAILKKSQLKKCLPVLVDDSNRELTGLRICKPVALQRHAKIATCLPKIAPNPLLEF